MKTHRSLLATALLATTLLGNSAIAAEIDCEMSFTLKSWSALYKKSSGSGTIKCNNGQSMNVRLEARGGGLSVGKSSIKNGKGEFSGVENINELLGTYASSDAHAGAVKSAYGQVVIKEDVTLALTGTGKGWNLGIALGNFKITRR
jgi:hypothetical protein